MNGGDRITVLVRCPGRRCSRRRVENVSEGTTGKTQVGVIAVPCRACYEETKPLTEDELREGRDMLLRMALRMAEMMEEEG